MVDGLAALSHDGPGAGNGDTIHEQVARQIQDLGAPMGFIEAGASDYITKPVDSDQLLSLLRVWLYQA